MDRPLPTPRVMLPRGANLRQPPLPPMGKYAVDSSLPRRRRPVTTALADTGLLYALAHRPKYLEMFLEFYGETLAVATAVEDEIRKIARVPQVNRAQRDLVLMGACADRLAAKFDDKTITVIEPSEDSTYLEAALQHQLREFDRAEAGRHGRVWHPVDVDRTKRHHGEMESILVATDIIKAGGTAIVLTNDRGASRAARQQGVSARHLRDILAELACANPDLKEEDLLAAFNEMTAHFGTLPAEVRPTDSSAFRCRAFGGACQFCDR